MDWVEFKNQLSQVADLDQDALHIYAAVLIQLVSAALLRRSLASFLPWLAVLAALLVNEAVDLWQPGRPVEEWQIVGGVKDVWNTLVLPTVLWLVARFAPSLMSNPRGTSPRPPGLHL